MQRLYSTFARGAPGAGLLLMRVVAAIALIFHATLALRGALPGGPTVVYLLTGVIGVLLLAGLGTPIIGALLAVFASLQAFLHPASPWACILLGTLGAALALLGPGAWSVDAYRFGRREVELPDRKP